MTWEKWRALGSAPAEGESEAGKKRGLDGTTRRVRVGGGGVMQCGLHSQSHLCFGLSVGCKMNHKNPRVLYSGDNIAFNLKLILQ